MTLISKTDRFDIPNKRFIVSQEAPEDYTIMYRSDLWVYAIHTDTKQAEADLIKEVEHLKIANGVMNFQTEYVSIPNKSTGKLEPNFLVRGQPVLIARKNDKGKYSSESLKKTIGILDEQLNKSVNSSDRMNKSRYYNWIPFVAAWATLIWNHLHGGSWWADYGLKLIALSVPYALFMFVSWIPKLIATSGVQKTQPHLTDFVDKKWHAYIQRNVN